MMSNALSLFARCGVWLAQISEAAATQPAATRRDLPPVAVGLLAVGVCLLGVWIVRRLINPRPLKLRNTPSRPNSVHPGHVLVVLAAHLAAYSLAKDVLANWYDPQGSRIFVLSSLCGQVVWLVGGLLVAGLCFRGRLRRGVGLSGRHWLCDTARGAIGYLAVAPVCFLLLTLGRLIIPERIQQTHEMLQNIGKMPPAWKAAGIISAVALAPLVEELFFRGLVQSMFRRYLRNPWLAIVCTSVLFSLMHWGLWYAMGAYMALSIALGYNYERSGRLISPIFIHAAFNAVSVWVYLAAMA